MVVRARNFTCSRNLGSLGPYNGLDPVFIKFWGPHENGDPPSAFSPGEMGITPPPSANGSPPIYSRPRSSSARAALLRSADFDLVHMSMSLTAVRKRAVQQSNEALFNKAIAQMDTQLGLLICLLSLALLCNLKVYGQLDVIISPRENYNSALDPDSYVNFYCTSTGGTIEWRLNNTVASNFIQSRMVNFTVAAPIEGGSFLSILSIPSITNIGNTSVQCRAVDTDRGLIQRSELVYLNIQGLLGPPPNLTLSEADEQLTRLYRWDAPETLDITNIDPDIQNYQVCYNLSAAEMTCTNVSSEEEREFKFSNVHVPLLFTVSAFNVVGEGSASTVVHQPSNCSNAEGGLSLLLCFLMVD